MTERRSFFTELRRRNVIRAAVLYGGAAWALAQGIAQLGPSLGMPEWGTRWFLVAACIGFPFWLAFAWFYEWTPEGFKREHEVEDHESITHHTGRKLDFAIIGVLALAVVLLLTDRFVLRRGVNQEADIAISKQSIAVLPFVDMSATKDQEYFTDGISEELLNLLAKIPELKVIGRTSSFQFKGKNEDLRSIGQKLSVAHLLEGSVRKSGDKIRLTAQLIRADDGTHLWSETYDRTLDDIFAVQDEIAGEVVKALKVTLLGVAPTVRETDPQAYALYLQAVQLGRQLTAEAAKQSNALYQKVLAIDPAYAPAWDGLSRNYTYEANLGLHSYEEGMRLAREAVDKALAIDPEYAPAHGRLGVLATLQGDLAGAARHYERALALNSTDLTVLGNAALTLASLGRLNETIALQEYVFARDPVNVTTLNNLGLNYFNAGRFDEAIAQLRTSLSLAPGRGGTHFMLGMALLHKGQPEAALAELQPETDEAFRMIGVPMAYHALGRTADADAALAALETKYEKEAPYNIAYVHAFRGDADQAFEWLDKAVEYGDTGLSEIVLQNEFANIHPDPRWLPFLRKIGKAPEQLAAIKFDVKVPK
jgi:adenylate cyclase